MKNLFLILLITLLLGACSKDNTTIKTEME